MAAEPFIYCAAPDLSGRIRVGGDEATHLIRALRARPGFQFIAFDGTGGAWLSRVTESKHSEVLAEVVSPLAPEDNKATSVSVAVGVVKGSRMDWAVEKAAELGAIRFLLLLTKYGSVSPGDHKVSRWRALALAAAKQARRRLLMEVTDPANLDSVLAGMRAGETCWALDLGADTTPLSKMLTHIGPVEQLLIVIGPEGGFADNEVDQLRRLGIPRLSLGGHPLRTETAVVVALGMIRETFIMRSPKGATP